jgi:hypothetical protein
LDTFHSPPAATAPAPAAQTVGDSIVKLPCQTVRTTEEYIKRPDCQISTPEKPPGHFEKTYPNDCFFGPVQQQKRFQSDQFPFLALKFGGFALVLLLAAYVHLYVT